MEASQQLLTEGQTLPVDPAILSALQDNLNMVAAWETKLAELGQRQVHETFRKMLRPSLYRILQKRLSREPQGLNAISDTLTCQES